MSDGVLGDNWLSLYFDKYTRSDDGIYKGYKGDAFIKIISSKCGAQSLSERLPIIDTAVIGLGFAGGLTALLQPSDVVIPVICSENYASDDNLELRNTLTKNYYSFLEKIIDITPAKVYTVESIKNETPMLINELISRGYDCVDMELYHFSKYCQHKSLQFSASLIISDNVISKPLNPNSSDGYLPLNIKSRNNVRILALRTLDFLFQFNS